MEKLIPAWYLLYCKKNEHDRAVANLINQGAECYYPKVLVEKIRRGKKSAKLEPLFPNYLFVYFDPNKLHFTSVRSTSGVASFVKIGNEPRVIPLQTVLEIKERESKLEHLTESFTEGEAVDIIDGPFQGTEAIFRESDGEQRSFLLIKMLNQQVDVQVPIDNKDIKKRTK